MTKKELYELWKNDNERITTGRELAQCPIGINMVVNNIQPMIINKGKRKEYESVAFTVKGHDNVFYIGKSAMKDFYEKYLKENPNADDLLNEGLLCRFEKAVETSEGNTFYPFILLDEEDNKEDSWKDEIIERSE